MEIVNNENDCWSWISTDEEILFFLYRTGIWDKSGNKISGERRYIKLVNWSGEAEDI
jgi:hypothetical protein